MTETPLLELKKVGKSFPSGDRHTYLDILEKLSLTVQARERIAIVGPSGSGKSTLLNLVGALDQPTHGKVLLEGQDLGELDDTALSRIRNEKIGFIFQSHHLLPQCTLLENVLVPALVNEIAPAEALSRARALLERVGLEGRLEHRPGQLSGGECQRVAVVRALINQPVLLLADEPTGALDQKTADTLTQLLLDLNQEENVALIVVTHSMALAGRMDKQYVLEEGKLSSS